MMQGSSSIMEKLLKAQQSADMAIQSGIDPNANFGEGNDIMNNTDFRPEAK